MKQDTSEYVISKYPLFIYRYREFTTFKGILFFHNFFFPNSTVKFQIFFFYLFVYFWWCNYGQQTWAYIHQRKNGVWHTMQLFLCQPIKSIAVLETFLQSLQLLQKIWMIFVINVTSAETEGHTSYFYSTPDTSDRTRRQVHDMYMQNAKRCLSDRNDV